MYRKEEERIKSGFDSVAPDLFKEIKQREYHIAESEEELFGLLKAQEHCKQQRDKVIPFSSRVVWGSIAAVVLCFLVWTQMLAPKAQATQVMIDINSKIQFMITEKDQVAKVVALSADSEKIVNEISQGTTLEEALYEILENLEQYDCFEEEDAGMLISCVNQQKEDSRKKISSVIQEYFKEQNLQVSLVLQEIEEKTTLPEKADEQGVSLGKYYFLKTIQEEYQIDTDKMYEKGMGDILQEIHQQGVDLAKDSRIEYVPGGEDDAPEAAEETEMPDEDEVTVANNKKEKGSKKTKTNDDAQNGQTGEKKAQTKKPANQSANQKEGTGEKKEERKEKNIIPVLPVPAPSMTPTPTIEVPETQITTEATENPAATPPLQKPQEVDGDRTNNEKNPSARRENSDIHKDREMEPKDKETGKNQTLDCDVDDMKEQIQEYMKNHPHSKKDKSQEKTVDKR